MVEFDFPSNAIKLGEKWHKCVDINDQRTVGLVSQYTILSQKAWHQDTDQQISEKLNNNTIRPSSSPWNVPVILVKKKDGSKYFVCDFWGLNDVTKKDTYPLPQDAWDQILVNPFCSFCILVDALE